MTLEAIKEETQRKIDNTNQKILDLILSVKLDTAALADQNRTTLEIQSDAEILVKYMARQSVNLKELIDQREILQEQQKLLLKVK